MYIVLNTLWKQNRSIQITELNSSYLLILSLDHLGTFPLLLNNINYMYWDYDQICVSIEMEGQKIHI